MRRQQLEVILRTVLTIRIILYGLGYELNSNILTDSDSALHRQCSMPKLLITDPVPGS